LELDRGIRETILGLCLSVLTMSLGLVAIKTKRLYIDLDCPSMACRALEEGEVILPVRLRDMAEARRFNRASLRLIKGMRKRKIAV